MNKKKYLFDELSKDEETRYLIENTKANLQYNEHMQTAYCKYSLVLFGQDLIRLKKLMKFNTESLLLQCMENSQSSPKLNRVSSSPGNENKSSTPMKKYQYPSPSGLSPIHCIDRTTLHSPSFVFNRERSSSSSPKLSRVSTRTDTASQATSAPIRQSPHPSPSGLSPIPYMNRATHDSSSFVLNRERSSSSPKRSRVSTKTGTESQATSTPMKQSLYPSPSGLSPIHHIDRTTLDSNSFVFNRERSSLSSPKLSTVSTRTETANQATSTPIKRSPYGPSGRTIYPPKDDIQSFVWNLQGNTSSSPKQGRLSTSSETENETASTPIKKTPNRLTPRRLTDLTTPDTHSLGSNPQQSSSNNPKQGGVSLSSETTKQASLTPVKLLENISPLQLKHFLYDRDNEASQKVTTSREKQTSPLETMRIVKEPQCLAQKNLSLTITDKGSPQTVSKNKRKQLPPKKINRSAPEPENSQHNPLSSGHQGLDKAQSYNLLSPNASNPESYKKKHERYEEATKISAIFPMKVTKNSSPCKEVVGGILTTDGGKNTTPPKKARKSVDRKGMGPAEESKQNIQSNDSKKGFSNPKKNWLKKSQIPGDTVSDAQESVFSDDNSTLHAYSGQDSKLNISRTPESKTFLDFERKRKSRSPSAMKLLFSTMPTVTQSSGRFEIEIDISYLSAEISSQISSVDCKSIKPLTDNIVKDRSPKNINISGRELKAGISRDFIFPVKCNITISPPVIASAIRDEGIDLGKDRLSYKLSTRSPPTNLSSATVSSQSVQNVDMDTLIKYKIQLSALISKREAFMNSIHKTIKEFKDNLVKFKTHMGNILYITQKISSVNKYHPTDEFQRNMRSLLEMASKCERTYDLCLTDVKSNLETWDKCFKQIDKIKSQNKSSVSNEMSLTIEAIKAYEENLKDKWGDLDTCILDVESKRSIFMNTAEEYKLCINQFVKCLIIVGILKPS